MRVTLQTLIEVAELKEQIKKERTEKILKLKTKVITFFLDTLGILAFSTVAGILFTVAYRFGYNV